MNARYLGHCNLCDHAIVEGDEITRNNNDRSHCFYVHATCKPTSGRIHRAGFQVTITKANSRDFTVGYSRQFVYESKANEQAEVEMMTGLPTYKLYDVNIAQEVTSKDMPRLMRQAAIVETVLWIRANNPHAEVGYRQRCRNLRARALERFRRRQAAAV